MIINKYTKTIVVFLLLLSMNVVFAASNRSVEFFASNNTKVIDLQTAFNRLKGNEQSELQNSMIDVMQVNHVEKGKFEDILGTYQMSNDKKITADNTEHFITSPYQDLSDEKIFSLAKELAIKLNQDSVAVFIQDNSSLSDVTVSFTSQHPRINDVVNMIHDKLPEQYNKAFSIHLTKKSDDFNNAVVDKLEWLGSTIDLDIIKQAFPAEKIDSRNGKFYLVYQDGRIERL